MAIKKILLVFSTVLITSFTAMLLNYGAKNSSYYSFWGITIVLSVIGINFLKFKIWGYIYNRFNLSESYPLVALFFPLIYLFAIISNEAKFEANKIIGVSLIISGIWIMNSKKVKA